MTVNQLYDTTEYQDNTSDTLKCFLRVNIPTNKTKSENDCREQLTETRNRRRR